MEDCATSGHIYYFTYIAKSLGFQIYLLYFLFPIPYIFTRHNRCVSLFSMIHLLTLYYTRPEALTEYSPSVTIVTNPERGLSQPSNTSIDKSRVFSHFSGRKMSQLFAGRVRLTN